MGSNGDHGRCTRGDGSASEADAMAFRGCGRWCVFPRSQDMGGGCTVARVTGVGALKEGLGR